MDQKVLSNTYSNLSSKHGGWNKRGGGAKFAKKKRGGWNKRQGWDFVEKTNA